MEKKYFITVVITIIFIIIIALFLILPQKQSAQEQESQKTTIGPVNYIEEQRLAVMQALELYHQEKQKGTEFSSQCLGTVGKNIKFAVDIVNIPRNQEDNNPENQCQDFRSGEIKHFIELDKNGNIVRIV